MKINILTFVALSLGFAMALLAFGPADLYLKLQREGITTTGVIADIECQKSTMIRYSFFVQDHAYCGADTSIEQCSTFKLGTPVPIVYLNADPTRNYSGNPTQALNNYLFVTFLASILLPGGATIALHFRRVARAQQAAQRVVPASGRSAS
jgi:hypothetical protein